MTAALVTLNVSVEQIERDLRAGKSVEEIAQDWSEPRANVYAIKRAMDAAAGAPAPAAPTPLHVARSAPVPATADAGLAALVLEASQSKAARTRSLGAKLDKLVEELQERLTAEQAEAAERDAHRRKQEAAVAEVARLEEQLRAARAKLGVGKSKRTSSTKTADNPSGGKSKRAAYDGGPPPSAIREWAAASGVDCPGRGTLPQRVIAAYRTAVGDG